MTAPCRIVFDVQLRRPGCVLLQAGLGGNVPRFDLLFPSETWLVEFTPNMAVYEATLEQVAQLSRMAREAVKEGGGA